MSKDNTPIDNKNSNFVVNKIEPYGILNSNIFHLLDELTVLRHRVDSKLTSKDSSKRASMETVHESSQIPTKKASELASQTLSKDPSQLVSHKSSQLPPQTLSKDPPQLVSNKSSQITSQTLSKEASQLPSQTISKSPPHGPSDPTSTSKIPETKIDDLLEDLPLKPHPDSKIVTKLNLS